MMADGCQHGEGEHHQRDVPVPAMPGTGLVVIEAEFVLGGLKTVLDRPALSLDQDQGLGRGSGRAPGGEEGQLTIADAAPDQQAPCPEPDTSRRAFACIEVRQFEIRPVVEPCLLGALARGQTLPG